MLRLPRIALDLDGVIADFFQKLLEEYNKRYQQKLSVSDIDCELENLGPDVVKKLIEIFNEPQFFLNLEPLPNAINTVSRYPDLGYQTTICTAPARINGLINGRTAAEKFDWIRKYLPFWANDVIITKHKKLVDVDIIIDDAPPNILSWCGEHPKGIGYLVDQPWNKKWTRFPLNAVCGKLEDVTTFINEFWCQDRGCFIYRLDELKPWKDRK